MIQIERMQECHISQIAVLEKEFFSAPWSENSLRSELSSDLADWFVALDGDRVVGYIGGQSVLGESDMMNLAVHPDHRRRGIAEALVHTLITHLGAGGNSCITLEVRVSNGPAIALYEKLGFREVGRRPKYYQNPREDALILKKEWEV